MKKQIPHVRLLVSVLIIAALTLVAKEPPGVKKDNAGFSKTTGTPTATLLNINKMSSWYNANGEQERNPNNGNSGLSYPRGTSYVIYASGLMLGGVATDGIGGARVTGFSYNKGFQQGAIVGTRTGVFESPADVNVRSWRIRKDYATADLRQDAAEINTVPLSSVSDGQISAVREQYKKDWREWPVQKGAPFYDVGYLDPANQITGAANGVIDWGEDDTYPAGDDRRRNGVLDDGEDVNSNLVLDGETPGVADADQVIWSVNNDLGTIESPWKTKALGLEVQNTIWGYNRTDALGNMIFKKFKIIYKGTATAPATSMINNMYLCQWADPDLGDSGDDYAGCDVDLSLGYIYNSTTLDAEYRKFSLAPPAAGYDFLQGPRAISPGDSAVFDLKYIQGYRNLPMTSFIYFAAGSPLYSDPPFSIGGSIQWYQMLRGLPPTPQGPPDPPAITDPITGLPTSFWLSGDPVKRTGWIDGNIDSPGDRRLLLTSGPFNMAINDTQELVSAIIAGVGSDNLASISVLKFYDKTAQAAYNNLFDLPKPPPAPKVSVVELDKGIIIQWDTDAAAIKTTEESNSKGFLFEGYNVYQLPSATAPITSAKKLATFDLITDPATVSQEEFDEGSGQVLVTPVQLGKNSGIVRYMYITQDAIRNKPLVNGQPFYFAVTAYNYNPDPQLVTKSFESSANVFTIIPHSPNPGIVLPYNINDTLSVASENVVGTNDGTVGITVFNPTVQVGGTYDIWYGGSGASTRTYTVVKNITGSTEYATVTATMLPVGADLADTSAFKKSKGSGIFTINDAKDQVSYSRINIASLSGPITSAHIHVGAAGVSGPVVHPFSIVNNSIIDNTWSIPDSLKDEFTSGNLYVNIHTALRPAGEIRGQIADGLFPRKIIASPAAVLPALTTYEENRAPTEGVAFYVSPAPLGAKSAQQVAPTTGAIVNVPNPEKTYSLAGPLSAWAGDKKSESIYEIRFLPGDSNYAVTLPRGLTTFSPPDAKYNSVPFAIYRDTTRLWPIITTTPTETLWNVDAANGLVNGKKVFDLITGVVDTVDGSNNNISYYRTLIKNAQGRNVPNPSNVIKGRLINGVNWVLKNISFVDEAGNALPPASGTTIRITMNKSIKIGDIRRFTLRAIDLNNAPAAKAEVSKVNVFPNPYYAVNTSEKTRQSRFVTINHLPKQATIRIFNLAGSLVTTIIKDSPEQFMEWNLTNHKGLPVASGIYLLHIDMNVNGQGLGVKILKSAIIMEQQFLDNY